MATPDTSPSHQWLLQVARRWPLLLALAFMIYSALLLTYVVGSWRQMHDDANAWLAADNTRRAQMLGDTAADLRSIAAANADIHEIRTFLANRDLGMSPRYGLNASRAAIEERFRQRAAELGRRWNSAPPRIVFIEPDAGIVADSDPGAGPLPAGGSDAALQIDPAGTVSVAAAVVHKEGYTGSVVTISPVAVFYRGLLQSNAKRSYRELLLTTDGSLLPGSHQALALAPAQMRILAGLADNVVLRAAATLGRAVVDTDLADSLLVKTAVPEVPLALVTFVPENQAYGFLLSRTVIGGAGALLLLMLLGSFKLDRMRRRAEQLEADMAAAHERQQLVEFRNVELAEEIRRREMVELALAESKERWELALAGADDGIWDWNLRSGEVFFSPRWKSMLGFDQTDLAGHLSEWQDLLHPDDRDGVLAELDRYFKRQADFFRVEMRLRCKDGSYKWILGRGRALFDATGKPLRMAGSHTDISMLKQAAAALEDRNAQLDALFRLSPDGLVLYDQAGLGKFANPAFLRMTGLLAEDIAGKPLAELEEALRRMAENPAQWDGLESCFDPGKVGSGETASGGQRHLLALQVPRGAVLELVGVTSEAGSVSRLLYVRDVTHEVEVDRMKSEFLSHAAHELRTPMASIFGFTELLMNQEFDEATRQDLLATIHRQTAWLVDIINELLDLARIEARRGRDFKLEAVAVGPLVEDVLAAMSIDLEQWPLVIDLPDGLPAVRADAAKLRQALTNVLGNAVKYSPAGGAIAVCADARTDARGQRQVGITVADHGIGMTAEQLGRVCERFYRADTSGNIPGTGLGMSIVKEIVELLGGTLDLASTPGQGTTVTLWLPADTAAPRNETTHKE